MVSLCLTSKRLHRLTVRNLYKTVNLHLGGTKDTNIAALLSPSNIGVAHIKQVDLWHDSIHDGDEEDAIEALARHTTFAVRMMLEFLPRNQLEKFRYVLSPESHMTLLSFCFGIHLWPYCIYNRSPML